MTKEALKNKHGKTSGRIDTYDVYRDILKFLKSNVCIPKGENRHQFADVLHEWVEDINKELQYSEYDSDAWYRSSLMTVPEYVHLRIKPSAPIYEYRYQIDTSGVCVWTACWYTDEEAITEIKSKFPYSEKMEETKQERK